MYGVLSLKDIRSTKDVSRWHMIRVNRTQNLAEHSFMVALIAGKLAEGLSTPLTEREERDMLRLSLLHDIPEVEYGDMPTPTKKKLKEIGQGDVYGILESHFWASRGAPGTPEWAVSGRVKNLVRLADLLEAYIFYKEEGFNDEIKERLAKDAMKFSADAFPEDNLFEMLAYEMTHLT